MNQYVIDCLLTASGAITGWVLARISARERISILTNKANLLQITQQEKSEKLSNELEQRKQELSQLHCSMGRAQERLEQFDYWRSECEKLNIQLRDQLDLNSTQRERLCEVTTRLEETELSSKEKQSLLASSEQRLNTQFENTANRLFSSNNYHFNDSSNRNLKDLIAPLRDQLDNFCKLVSSSFGEEARERNVLTYEVRQLRELNAEMAREAVNLTRALKGDNKIQGNWGEVVLNKVLEDCGLREGHEYTCQVSMQSDDNRRLRPDVIITLPHGKSIVIDAKVTLVSYERYHNADSDSSREQAARDYTTSLRNHIKSLGSKSYQDVLGSNSLDYVLMFIPIEPAFMLAVSHRPKLVTEALDQNVMLVSPTTILIALRTISNLWRYERQNRNAQLISDRASSLYDKVRLFIDDMESIGSSLDRASQSYYEAMKKLAEGRGNLVAQAEALKSLGIKTKKPISSKTLENSDTDIHSRC
jgi:DNA recombination protein RmuC